MLENFFYFLFKPNHFVNINDFFIIFGNILETNLKILFWDHNFFEIFSERRFSFCGLEFLSKFHELVFAGKRCWENLEGMWYLQDHSGLNVGWVHSLSLRYTQANIIFILWRCMTLSLLHIHEISSNFKNLFSLKWTSRHKSLFQFLENVIFMKTFSRFIVIKSASTSAFTKHEN